MGLFYTRPPLVERFDSVALADAVLCEECKNITAARNGHCPVCGWPGLIGLMNVLDRKENETLERIRNANKPRGTKLFRLTGA